MNPKAIVPSRIRALMRERQRRLSRSILLRRGIWMLRRQSRIWEDLVDGWGQPEWSADAEYLEAVAAAASVQRGPILECGSGLTTLVLSTIAERTGSTVWSLEHDPDWFEVTESALRRIGLKANLCLTPLRDYGEFEWYDVTALELPTFSLVVCDGPPGSTRGGRYGLLPLLAERLARGCMILLDDAGRPGEQEVLRRWESLASMKVEIVAGSRPFAIVRQLVLDAAPEE